MTSSGNWGNIGGSRGFPKRSCPPISLTDTAERNAKPGKKAIKLSDDRGLYLELSPAGGKWWRHKYRFEGTEKRLSLGVYPDVGLKEARSCRDEAPKLLANGVDPGEHRKAQKLARTDEVANSFDILTREWFTRNSPTWAASHSDLIMRRLERDVFPWIGGDLQPPQNLLAVARKRCAAVCVQHTDGNTTLC